MSHFPSLVFLMFTSGDWTLQLLPPHQIVAVEFRDTPENHADRQVFELLTRHVVREQVVPGCTGKTK